jgi:hypothetical protein
MRQRLSPSSQQMLRFSEAQNSPALQHLVPHGRRQTQFGLPLPPPHE